MNKEYIKSRLTYEGVPTEIINDAVEFMSLPGWREMNVDRECVFILGLEKTFDRYYWICYTPAMDIKFIPCTCNINRQLIGNVTHELPYDIKNICKQINTKKSGDILLCLCTEYPEKNTADKLEDMYDICLSKYDILNKKDEIKSDVKKETKLSKDNLSEREKDYLLDYAIESLNKVTPLTIKLSPIETLRYEDFKKKHRNCTYGMFGANGGDISLKVTGTGLGWSFECMCNECGDTECITDISQW